MNPKLNPPKLIIFAYFSKSLLTLQHLFLVFELPAKVGVGKETKWNVAQGGTWIELERV